MSVPADPGAIRVAVTEIDARPVAGRDGRRGRGHTDRRSELLDSLEEVFLAEGFTHLAIGEMVGRLRCSRRTIYSLSPQPKGADPHRGGPALAPHRAGGPRRRRFALRPERGHQGLPGRSVTTLARATPAFNTDVDSYLPTLQLYERHLSVALVEVAGLVGTGVE